MVICGYQGIGKTTLSKKVCNVVDLDSSLFVDMTTYYEVIKYLDSLGKIVLTSTHSMLRDALRANGIDYYVVCPKLELREQWIGKLTKRYQEDDSDKNFRSWTQAILHYDSHIKELMEKEKERCLLIEEMDYFLEDIIKCLL